MNDVDRQGGMRSCDDARCQANVSGITIPASLQAYVATRTDDLAGSLRALVAEVPAFAIWTPIVGSLALLAALKPCRFDAQLLLKREGDGLSATVVARKWSVTLAGAEAWVDVEWPSETMAMWLVDRPVRTQIDFPFLSPGLTVRGSELMGTFRRFQCSELVPPVTSA